MAGFEAGKSAPELVAPGKDDGGHRPGPAPLEFSNVMKDDLTAQQYKDGTKSLQERIRQSDLELKNVGGPEKVRTELKESMLHFADAYQRIKDFEQALPSGIDTELFRKTIKDMDKTAMAKSAVDSTNPELKKLFALALGPEDRKELETANQLRERLDASIASRLEMAELLSKHGFSANDKYDKYQAQELIKEAKKVAGSETPPEFDASFKAADYQLRHGQAINLKDGAADAFVSVDQATMRSLSRAIGNIIYPLSAADDLAEKEKSVQLLAKAMLQNEGVANKVLDEQISSGAKLSRAMFADTAALLSTAGLSWAAKEGLAVVLPRLGFAGKVAAVGTGLLGGGLVGQEISANDFKTAQLRNMEISALVYGGSRALGAASELPGVLKFGSHFATGAVFGGSYESLDYVNGTRPWDEQALSKITSTGLAFGFLSSGTLLATGAGKAIAYELGFEPVAVGTNFAVRGAQMFALPTILAHKMGSTAGYLDEAKTLALSKKAELK